MARAIIARTFAPIELFLAAGAIYLFLTFLVTRAAAALETRLSPDLRPLPRR
jgi:ABC-type arginine/histidine transport system permease subunit